MRPNAPRMVTVLAALALLAVGLLGSGVLPVTIQDIPAVASLLRQYDIEITKDIAFACLTGSPMLLAIGSLLPGI